MAQGSTSHTFGTCLAGSDGREKTNIVAYTITSNSGISTTSITTALTSEHIESTNTPLSSTQVGTSSPTSKPIYIFTAYSDNGCSQQVYSLRGYSQECGTNPHTNYSSIITVHENIVNDTYWISRDCNGK
jgi:hypothetical protein